MDITTCNIRNIKPLEFDEILEGDGAKCGSTSIDRNFHELMVCKFGHAFTEMSKKTGPGSQFMASFEESKHAFKPRDNLEEGDDDEFRIRGLLMNHEDCASYDSEEQFVILT